MNGATRNFDILPKFCGKGTRIRFSEAEDNLLKALVSMYGENWKKIEAKFNETMSRLNQPKRSAKSLRLRWQCYLNKNSKLPFTTEEDELLKEKFEEYGGNWVKTVSFFQGRSVNDLKIRCRELNIAKSKRSDLTAEEILEITEIQMGQQKRKRKRKRKKINARMVAKRFNKRHPDSPISDRTARKYLQFKNQIDLIEQNSNTQNQINLIAQNLNEQNQFEQNQNQNLQNSTLNQNILLEQTLIEPISIESNPTDFNRYSISSLLNPQRLELEPIDGSFIYNNNIPPLISNQQNQEI